MIENNKILEIQELIKQLNKYSYEYYTLGNPTVSDTTYDGLYDKLVKLEEETGIIYSNSPTQNVGNKVLSFLKKVTHEYPLLSLNKTKKEEDIIKWSNKKDIVGMLKLDGLTLCLTYIDGKLVGAETRGNGKEGEDIIHNAKVFTNIPLTIPTKEKTIVVGEAIIDYPTFEEINSKLPNDKKYKNPRNLVSGTIRQLDSSICKERKPKFIAYNLLTKNDNTKISHLEILEQLGFTTVPYIYLNQISLYKEVESCIYLLKNKATLLQYPIDGLVFTYNDIEYCNLLGNTSHHPLHSIAFKFENDIEITKLIDVKWQIGRTGVITPVAIFEPIELYGTTVSKATIHNLSIFNNLNLAKGDEISITKANEIIPQIIDNLDINNESVERLNNLISIPTVCPYCGKPTKIEISNNAQFLHCSNPNCNDILIQRITHYCSRNAMNITGLSKKTIEKLISLNLLKDIPDLYNLSFHNKIITSQKGFGIKAYTNLIESIEQSKECKLFNFIYALGIENVGLSTSEDICNYFNNDIDKLRKASINELLKIKDIGDVTAESIYNFFNRDKEAIALLNSLLPYINFIDNKMDNNIEINTSNPLYGKKVYPTGKFTLKKSEIKDILNSLGAEISNGYSKTLDYLICGGDTSKSSKVTKAKKDNIPLMNEEEFLSIIKKYTNN